MLFSINCNCFPMIRPSEAFLITKIYFFYFPMIFSFHIRLIIIPDSWTRNTSDAAVLRQADRVLLPGVGEASSAMAKLRERGLDALIPTLTQPVLGICIGMQLMCLDSEEGDTRCLGIFPAHVVRLRGGENPLKIPHVGWDTVGRLRSPLFDDLGEGTYLYYVHSYAAQACDATIAQTDYGGIFSAALGRGNFFGTQFHPEKSGRAGERILRNFLKL